MLFYILLERSMSGPAWNLSRGTRGSGVKDRCEWTSFIFGRVLFGMFPTSKVVGGRSGARDTEPCSP